MNSKNILTLIKTDHVLKAMFIGMIACGLALLVSAITAAVWYF